MDSPKYLERVIGEVPRIYLLGGSLSKDLATTKIIKYRLFGAYESVERHGPTWGCGNVVVRECSYTK